MISKYAPDKVRVNLLNTTCMRAFDNTSALLFDELEIQLPRQASSAEASVANTIAMATVSTVSVMLASNAVMSIITSFILNLLWGLLNGLQIIALTCLFRVRLPSNVFIVNVAILQLASFDLVRFDKVYNFLFNFSETPSFNGVFEESKFIGSNFIIGAGPLFLTIWVYIIYLINRLLWQVCCQGCFRKNCPLRVQDNFKQHNWQTTSVRFVLEGTIDILLWVLIALSYVKSSGSFGELWADKLSNLVACVFLITLIAAPVMLLNKVRQYNKVIKSKRAQLQQGQNDSQELIPEWIWQTVHSDGEQSEQHDEDINRYRNQVLQLEVNDEHDYRPSIELKESQQEANKKMKILFQDFKLNVPSLLYYPLFILRRMVLVLVLIYMPDYGLLQISTQVVTSLATLVYAVSVKPYEDSWLNQQEITNEFFTWLTTYCMLIFSNWIPDETTMPYSDFNLKTAVGRFMLGLIGVFVGINVFIIAREMTLNLKAKFRQRKMIKMAQEIEELKKKRKLEEERIEGGRLRIPQKTVRSENLQADVEAVTRKPFLSHNSIRKKKAKAQPSQQLIREEGAQTTRVRGRGQQTFRHGFTQNELQLQKQTLEAINHELKNTIKEKDKIQCMWDEDEECKDVCVSDIEAIESDYHQEVIEHRQSPKHLTAAEYVVRNFHASNVIFAKLPYPGAKKGTIEYVANARALINQWPSVDVIFFKPLVEDSMYRIMEAYYNTKNKDQQLQ